MDRSWSESELAYFAGLLDGEGCISLNYSGKSKRSRNGIRVYVGNTDARMIEWIHSHFGGTVYLRDNPSRNPRHKPLWMWVMPAADTTIILPAVIPYLVVKREQAQLLLDYEATVMPIGSNAPVSTETLATRDRVKSRLSILNKRGIA